MKRTTVLDGFVRVNLLLESQTAGYPSPKWVIDMVNDLRKCICEDLHISSDTAVKYMYNYEGKSSERLAELLRTYFEVDVVAYDMTEASSRGLLINIHDPIVVEYILKSNSDEA